MRIKNEIRIGCPRTPQIPFAKQIGGVYAGFWLGAPAVLLRQNYAREQPCLGLHKKQRK